jgi:hypothetical protein
MLPDDSGADAPGAKDEAGRPGARRKPLPSPETVVSETEITSPKGRVYRVIKTNQTDPYDKPAKKPARRKGKRRRKP